MKKFVLFGFALLLISFTSCKGKSSESIKTDIAGAQSLSERTEPVSFTAEMDDNNQISFASLQNFFKLDYTAEYPDSEFKTQNDADKESETTSASSEKSESVIPGIRKLTDYVTKYLTKKPVIQAYEPKESAVEEETDDSTKDFFVEDWGPQGKVVAGENHPTFYVIFSRPARSLQALDKPQTTSDIMTIEPPLPGLFRWYGTKHLSFEADIPADPTVQYTIRIKKDIKSASGKPLTGETVFSTTAEPIEFINLWGV